MQIKVRDNYNCKTEVKGNSAELLLILFNSQRKIQGKVEENLRIFTLLTSLLKPICHKYTCLFSGFSSQENTQSLKITQKVSFYNIASEASYVYCQNCRCSNNKIFTPFRWVRLGANDIFLSLLIGSDQWQITIFTPFCWVSLGASYIFLSLFDGSVQGKFHIFTPFRWVTSLAML